MKLGFALRTPVKSLLWSVSVALVIVCSGCGGDKLLGKFVVVDMESTLASVNTAPPGFSPMTLPEYREHVKKRYAGKSLEFSDKAPHAFLIPVPLKGSVEGIFHGGWTRDEKDKDVILIYEWVSDSMYLLWGRAALSNRMLNVTLEGPEFDHLKLYLRKG